jgi:D-aminopeptidase
MTLQDLGVTIGTLPPGPRNKITDVAGVTVGHCTLNQGDCRTGVTVVLPAQDNLFGNKLTAACFVHNGFGKTAGLMQIDELGTLETPIALTNTLNVGLVQDALVEYTLDCCRRDGISLRSLNPVVGECNDGRLSNIALRPVKQPHVLEAIRSAAPDFQEGSLGAGTGTICYGLKGGIGSASRTMEIDGKVYTLGVLVQSNFGSTADLVIDGRPVGRQLVQALQKKITPTKVDAGSIMMVVATDLPLSSRQLRRVIRRCGVGLARTGSYLGHGSGEVMLGFTTANRVPHEGPDTRTQQVLREDLLDLPFRAAAEATEEAVLRSMLFAETTVGYTGLTIYSLSELLEECPSAAAFGPGA